jgi:hypothetical protein
MNYFEILIRIAFYLAAVFRLGGRNAAQSVAATVFTDYDEFTGDCRAASTELRSSADEGASG